MKKYRKLLAILTVLFVLLPVCASQLTAVAAKKGIKRMNIMFVTDESLSMEQNTDPDSMRYDAVKLFTQEITDTGNYLGSVSFAEDVLAVQELKEINGRQDKKSYTDAIAGVACDSWTNIGGGFLKGVEMLEAGGDPNLNSAVIILSDGFTEMPDDDARKASLEKKAEAVEICRQKGIPVYTICLNVDGRADPDELRQISDATGGMFTEVKNPEDLKNVELLYSRLLFGENADNEGEEVEFGQDGTVTKEFDVPKVGVEELNIMIDGNVKDLNYTDPNGKKYSGADVEDITIFGNGYAMTKLIKPMSGTWTLTAYGDPNTKILLRYMFNTNFYIESSVTPDKDYQINAPITFSADICDSDGKISDPAELGEIKAYVTIKSGDQEERVDMAIAGDHFEGAYTPKEEGTYYASITAEGPLATAEPGEPYEISVTNATRIPPQDTLSAHANLWPIIGGKATIDLNGAATDPDGDPLKYTIDSTAFREGDYIFADNKLTVEKYSIPKGSFTIRATDPRGAYCTFDVLFTSTNIGIIMAIIAGLGILAAIIAFLIGLEFIKRKAFMGTISVAPYDSESYEEYDQISDKPGRGRRPLAAFGMGDMGFAKGTLFEADGKNKRVKFKSKKPFYTDMNPGGTKEAIINSRQTLTICPTSDMKKGIKVSFKSILDPDDDGLDFTL